MLAEFKIPNPAPRPHPEWTAQPLPVRATDGDLEVTLTGFRAYQTSRETSAKQQRYPRTECSFSFRENNRESLAWRPASFELSDATGNHWKPSRTSGGNPYRASVENGVVRTEFLGALWPGESAWKIRGEFKRVADFPESELLHIPKIRIPDAREVSQRGAQFDCNGATVELAAVIGGDVADDSFQSGATLDRAGRIRLNHLVNAERRRGCITVVFEGEILSRARRLSFVSAMDERGTPAKLESADEPADLAATRLTTYSFILRPPEGAHELNIVMAVSESRFVEFLARPEQFKE